MKFNRLGVSKRFILAKKYKKAKKLLTPLAKRKNAQAQLLLGYLYYGGDTGTSRKQAYLWLKQSAQNGNLDAIALTAQTDFKVGCWSSVPNTKKSLALTLKAAKKGSAEAQRSLACAYIHGDLVPTNIELAIYWNKQAAKQGLADSQCDLGTMYLYGDAGYVDIAQAIFWYEKAASKDYNIPEAQWAAEALSRIYSGTPDIKFHDGKKALYWESRAKMLSTLDFRPFPNWFYK